MLLRASPGRYTPGLSALFLHLASPRDPPLIFSISRWFRLITKQYITCRCHGHLAAVDTVRFAMFRAAVTLGTAGVYFRSQIS